MSHFYFVVKSIQQEPLLVEWLWFHLSDSGEILALDVVQCDEKNRRTLKPTDAKIELASPLVIYDPSLVTDPNNPSPHKNKKACLQSQVVQVVIDKQAQSQFKLLRFTSNMRDFFNTGEFFSHYELEKEWKKGFQQDPITKKTTNYKVPLKLVPSEYTQLDCINEVKVIDSINAQYSLLQEQFSQEVQGVISKSLKSSEAANEISDIEKVIQFSEALATALSEEKQENLLPFLANMMDGITSSIGFGATVLMLLQKKVEAGVIAESSFPARFLAYNIASKFIVTTAYQLLKEISNKQDDERISQAIKESIGTFCSMADLYSISFSKFDIWGQPLLSSRGFENIALSGAIIQGEASKRINSDKAMPFRFTLNEKSFQQLFAFFKDKFLLLLLGSNEENWEKLTQAINQLDVNVINALYDNIIIQELDETKKELYLKRLCECLSDNKVETLLEGAPHAFHWVILDHKTIRPPCAFEIKEVLHRATKAILTINNFEDILSGVSRLVENSTSMSEYEEATVVTVLSFLFEHPELFREMKIGTGIIILCGYDVAKKWINSKEEELISHLKALMIQFVLNPIRENYLSIDDEYKRSYKQYEFLRNESLLSDYRGSSCPISKNELYQLIIVTLLEQQGKQFLLKPCVDAVFSDFDNFYPEKEMQVRARKDMLAFYFKQYNTFNDYPWLTQLVTIFEPQALWSFLQVNGNGNKTFLSFVVNDDAFIPFFDTIAKDEKMVLELILSIDDFEILFGKNLFLRFSPIAIQFIVLAFKKCIPSLTITQCIKMLSVMADLFDKRSHKVIEQEWEGILFLLESIVSALKEKQIYDNVLSLLSFHNVAGSGISADMPTSQPTPHPDYFLQKTKNKENILKQLFMLMPTIDACGKILSLLCKDTKEDRVSRFFELIQEAWLSGILVFPNNLTTLGKLLSYLDDDHIYSVINNTSSDFWTVVNISLNFPDLLEPLTNLQKEVVCDQIEKRLCSSLYDDWNAIWTKRNVATTGETMCSIYSLKSGAARTQGVSKFLGLFSTEEIGAVYQSYVREMKKNNIDLGKFEWLDVLGFLDINQKCTLLSALSPKNIQFSYDSLLSCVYHLLMDVKNNRNWNEASDSIRASITYFLNHEQKIQVLFEKILPLLSVERQKTLMDCISKEKWMEIFNSDYLFTTMKYLKKDLFEPLWNKISDHVMIIRTGDFWKNIVTNMPEEQKTYIINSAMRYFQQELIDSKAPPLEQRYPQYQAKLSEGDSALYSEQLRIESVIIQMLEDYLKPRSFLQGCIWEQNLPSEIKAIAEKLLKEMKSSCSDVVKNIQKGYLKADIGMKSPKETQSNMICILLSIREYGGNRSNNQLYRRSLYAIDMLAKDASCVSLTSEMVNLRENSAADSAMIKR